MTDREICAGIEANVPIAGRNNLIRAPHFTIIDDCYNANPASIKASLDVLAFADTRKAAILGDMFELGENEKQMHREVGIHAVRKGIDVLICIGSLMKSAADGALEYLEQQKKRRTYRRDAFVFCAFSDSDLPFRHKGRFSARGERTFKRRRYRTCKGFTRNGVSGNRRIFTAIILYFDKA